MRLAVLGPSFNAWHDFLSPLVLFPLRHVWYYIHLWDITPRPPPSQILTRLSINPTVPAVDAWIVLRCSSIGVATATTCDGTFCSEVSLPQDQHDTLAHQDGRDAWVSQIGSALLPALLSHFTVASRPSSPSPPPPCCPMSPGHTVSLVWCLTALIPHVLTSWSDQSINKGDEGCGRCCLLVEFEIILTR